MFLFPFTPEMFVEVEVYREGVLIKRHIQRAHSPLMNWVRVVRACFARESQTVVDLNGASQTFSCYSAESWCNCGGNYGGAGMSLRVNAGDNDASFGILVGRGTAPVQFTDYNLSTKYEQGSGIGRLDYDSVTVLDVDTGQISIGGKNYNYARFAVMRPVNNLTSTNQTVTEIGLAVLYFNAWGTNFKFLIFRDLLDNPITIPPQGTAVFRYHFRWLIPA